MAGYKIIHTENSSNIYIIEKGTPVAVLNCDGNLCFVMVKSVNNTNVVRIAKQYNYKLEYLKYLDFEEFRAISIRSIIRLLEIVVYNTTSHKKLEKYSQEILYMQFLEDTYREHFKKAVLELAN